jgi:type I restriction enzyme R subunit
LPRSRLHIGSGTLGSPASAIASSCAFDRTLRDNVRARPRVLVKRILRKHGDPPDRQEQPTQALLEQAQVLSDAWARA